MSRETWEEHFSRPGRPANVAAVRPFVEHRRGCKICKLDTYAYIQCPEGRRLAVAILDK